MVNVSAQVKSASTQTAGFQETEIGLIPDDWIVTPLSFLADLYQPKTISANEFTSWGYPVYGANGVVGYYHSYNHATRQIAVTCRGSTCGTVNYTVEKSWITGNSMVVNCDQNTNINKDFLYHSLQGSDLTVCITGTGQPQIVRTPLAAFPLAVPQAISEQRAIAEALSDAVSFIESLEQLIAKKCALKEGVMQELLSGRRRLSGSAAKWSERSFGEIFDFLPTATNPRSDLREDTGAYYVHYGDIHTRFHGHLDFRLQQPSRIDRSKCKNAALIKNGDWVMADASEDFDGVGKCIEILGLSDENQAVSGLHTFLLREKEPTFVQGFKGHLGNSKSLHEQYMRVMTGMKVFGVSKTALKNLRLPIPTNEEQLQITAILDKMETEIRELENKAKKARYCKQGMMQELLTGRIRLV